MTTISNVNDRMDPGHAAQPVPPRASLMGIPVELRLKVYRYLLSRPTPIVTYSEDREWDKRVNRYEIGSATRRNANIRKIRTGSITLRSRTVPNTQIPALVRVPAPIVPRIPSIILVSRLVTEEALSVLYGENTFKWLLSPWPGRKIDGPDDFTPRNRVRVRRVLLVINEPILWAQGGHHTFSDEDWKPVLANVSRIRIVIKGSATNMLSSQGGMTSYQSAMRAAMAYLDNNIAKDLVVEYEMRTDINNISNLTLAQDPEHREQVAKFVEQALVKKKTKRAFWREDEPFFKLVNHERDVYHCRCDEGADLGLNDYPDDFHGFRSNTRSRRV